VDNLQHSWNVPYAGELRDVSKKQRCLSGGLCNIFSDYDR
jgi:hypothetical protein